jgi:two-component system chemotaxis response regulator CheB
MSPPIRVLVADDSVTIRRALVALLAEEPSIEVVGEAADGVEAVEKACSLLPDVITMDVMMPRLDGLAATSEIMAEAASRILIVSSLAASQQDLAFRSLAAGALELLAKPVVLRADELKRWGRTVTEAIRLMSEVPVVTRLHHATTRPRRITLRFHTGSPLAAFGMVASTGGPQAVARILAALPSDLPIPILVAQHIAEGFTDGLVRWFSSVSALKIVVATDGCPCAPGHVYLAPAGRDLEVDRTGALRVTPNSAGHVPSGDKLLTSIARTFGARGGGIVLSGMGDDGAHGLLEIKAAGGLTLAQEENSCVVFGMPKAALLLDAAERHVGPDAVAPIILDATGSRLEAQTRLV